MNGMVTKRRFNGSVRATTPLRNCLHQSRRSSFTATSQSEVNFVVHRRLNSVPTLLKVNRQSADDRRRASPLLSFSPNRQPTEHASFLNHRHPAYIASRLRSSQSTPTQCCRNRHGSSTG